MPGDLRTRRPSAAAVAASAAAPAAPTTSAASQDSSSARAKIDKSGLYDLQQVKRLLDDEIIAFMEHQGYMEAVLVSNVKIIAGSLAVAAALYSHFNPWDFPSNKPLVLACVLFYAFCIGLINAVSYLWEASAVFVGYLGPKARRVSKGALANRIWVSTTIGNKGSSAFKVELRTAPRQATPVQVTHPYETYFTEEGRFLVDVFRNDMTAALHQVDTKKAN